MDVHEPFVALGVLGLDQPQREMVLKELEFRIEDLIDSPQWLIKF